MCAPLLHKSSRRLLVFCPLPFLALGAEEILSIAAMLSVQSVFVTPKGGRRKADRLKMKFAVKEVSHFPPCAGLVKQPGLCA